MKWAKSFGLLFLSFCLFFGLSPLKQANAAISISQYNIVIIYKNKYNNKYSAMASVSSNINFYDTTLDGIPVVNNATQMQMLKYLRSGTSDMFYDTPAEVINAINTLDPNYYGFTGYGSMYTPELIVYKGNINYSGNNSNVYDSYEDYQDSIAPSWWEKVKDAFMDFVGSEALSDVLSGNWLSFINDVLFGDLWTVKVGEGEDDMIVPETVSATPTPSPTPIPTPIPYSTVINPDSGEITYHYTIDVSGTPVPTSSIYPPVTSSPPGPGSGSTIDEPVAVEDYYEPEDSLSVPKLRIFKFLLRMTGNDVDVGMDSLDDNMAVMDATLEDNAEAISGVGDLFQLIPVKWFILIGTLACFPVIAAMIKSLLG